MIALATGGVVVLALVVWSAWTALVGGSGSSVGNTKATAERDAAAAAEVQSVTPPPAPESEPPAKATIRGGGGRSKL